MSYILREKAFTAAECRATPDQYITGIVTITLQDIIFNDFEGFLDVLEHKMLGDIGVLTDVEYKVVGNGMNDILHIKVSGFAELVGGE